MDHTLHPKVWHSPPPACRLLETRGASYALPGHYLPGATELLWIVQSNNRNKHQLKCNYITMHSARASIPNLRPSAACLCSPSVPHALHSVSMIRSRFVCHLYTMHPHFYASSMVVPLAVWWVGVHVHHIAFWWSLNQLAPVAANSKYRSQQPSHPNGSYYCLTPLPVMPLTHLATMCPAVPGHIARYQHPSTN
jgi:hypothetical protein